MFNSPGGAVVAIAICIFLGVWLLLTLLNQHNYTRTWVLPILRYDLGSIVPVWTFFAPNPGRTDTHVVYRDIYEDGARSPWHALKVASRPGAFGVSCGERRVSKGVVDLQHELFNPRFLSLSAGPTLEPINHKPSFHAASPAIMLSRPYLAILNLVTTAPHDPFAVGIQFTIASSDGPEHDSEATVRFVSGCHALPGRRSL